jgi:hypothetical protein
MSERRESTKYTLYGDLDGITVKDLRAMLDDYPEDAVIDVRSEPEYVIGGWSNEWKDFFVFRWEE